MGVKQSTDISQEIMEDVLRDIKEVKCYLDNVGCFNDSWQHHLQMLERVLQCLQDNGFAVNPAKCEWAVQETDWLGYWLTPPRLKPWRKKIDAILRILPPQTLKDIRSIIGAVTYYCDMYPRRLHILAPLTDLTKGTKGKLKTIKWEPQHQQAFEAMKAVITYLSMSIQT
jgi:Reverse transcriptase (RNA-dependent DNA polymerase)